VIDSHPPYRHKRFDKETLTRLESILDGDPADVLIQALARDRFAPWKEILEISGLEDGAAREILDQLIGDSIALELGKKSKKFLTLKSTWESTLSGLDSRIEDYHQKYPMKVGMALEELKSQSKLADNVFKVAVEGLITAGNVIQTGPNIKKLDFEIRLSAEQNKLTKGLLDQFAANPTQPPSVVDCKDSIGEDLYNALIALNELKQLSNEVVFTPDAYQSMVEKLKKKITKDGPITVAQTRDMFGSSRKYMLAFLERLDAEGVTVREGDVRRLKE